MKDDYTHMRTSNKLNPSDLLPASGLARYLYQEPHPRWARNRNETYDSELYNLTMTLYKSHDSNTLMLQVYDKFNCSTWVLPFLVSHAGASCGLFPHIPRGQTGVSLDERRHIPLSFLLGQGISKPVLISRQVLYLEKPVLQLHGYAT